MDFTWMVHCALCVPRGIIVQIRIQQLLFDAHQGHFLKLVPPLVLIANQDGISHCQDLRIVSYVRLATIVQAKKIVLL
jgi:hypothetical protein